MVCQHSRSGGKSLVSEVLALRRLLTTGRPFMLVLPFVSLCAEKAAHLGQLLEPMARCVKGFYGGLGGGTVISHDTGTTAGKGRCQPDV